MEPIPADTERSLRRSTLRRRALLMTASLGECYASQLARAIGVDVQRLRWAIFGRMPAYSDTLSLVALGLVEVAQTPHGRVFRITPRGLRKARSLTRRARRGRSERLE